MALLVSPNVPTTTPGEQLQVLYHFLDHCCEFPVVDFSVAFASVAETSDGVLNTATSSRLNTSSAFFDASWVGHYVAVHDSAVPGNNAVVRITGFISSTEVQANSPVAYFSTSTGVEFRVFDPAAAPAAGEEVVFGNRVANPLRWQARLFYNVAPAVVGCEFSPYGSWNVAGGSFDVTACADHFLWSTVAQTFMWADPAAGWFCVVGEDVGGVGSNRALLWAGSLTPFHAPGVSGYPSDTSYGAVFGSTTAAANNISRDTSVANNCSVGQSVDANLNVTTNYFSQKRLITAGTDMHAVAAAATNLRSGAQDDYDVVCLEDTTQGFRGKVRGMRITNDTIANRTLLSSSETYVIGSGLAIAWNGKAVV